jgi:hypothetical protein
MEISRRRFIKSSTIAAFAAGVALNSQNSILAQRRTQGTSLGYPIPLKAQQEPTYMFTRATFEPYVGGIFQVPDARSRMIELTLVRTKDLTPSAAENKLTTGRPPQTDSFSLSFSADRQLPPFTSIHQISHPSLGKFDLYLTPGVNDGVNYYEAVFNHI